MQLDAVGVVFANRLHPTRGPPAGIDECQGATHSGTHHGEQGERQNYLIHGLTLPRATTPSASMPVPVPLSRAKLTVARGGMTHLRGTAGHREGEARNDLVVRPSVGTAGMGDRFRYRAPDPNRKLV